jgi:hypothetical protein
MLINLIVGSAVLLFGLYGFFWLRSPALRARIERPKHAFMEKAQAFDNDSPADSAASPGSQRT